MTVVRFLVLVTTMVTKVDHGNHRSNDRGNHRSNHRGYYNGNNIWFISHPIVIRYGKILGYDGYHDRYYDGYHDQPWLPS